MPVHHWCNGGIERVVRAQILREQANTFTVAMVALHQDIGHGNLQALRAQTANGGQRPAQGAMNFRNRIVDFRTVRVDADLNLLDVQLAQAGGLTFAYQQTIRFYLHVKPECAGIRNDFETVRSNKGLSAADSEKEYARVSKLFQQGAHLGGAQFVAAMMVEVTMLASLVAAVRDVKMNAERHAVAQSLFVELRHQAHEEVLPVTRAGIIC